MAEVICQDGDLVMSNERISLTVRPGQGADVLSLTHLPTSTQVLWRSHLAERDQGAQAPSESRGLLLALSHVDLVKLCDVRLLIEPIQAALAAQNAATSDVSRLQSALTRLQNSHDDANGHVLADLEFHAAIAELAGHEVYASIVAVVGEPVTRGMVLGTKVPRAVDFSDDHHDLIAQAILDGRSLDAERATRDHLTYVREYLLLHRAELAIWRGYLE